MYTYSGLRAAVAVSQHVAKPELPVRALQQEVWLRVWCSIAAHPPVV